jgi:hypothetical protein
MATNLVGSDGAPTRDYTTLAAWWAVVAAAGVQETAECYDDGASLGPIVTGIAAYGVSIANPNLIIAAAGEAPEIETSAGNIIDINGGHWRIEGLTITKTDPTLPISSPSGTVDTSYYFESCIFDGGGLGNGMISGGIPAGSDCTLIVRNCEIYNCGSGWAMYWECWGANGAVSPTFTCVYENNTVYSTVANSNGLAFGAFLAFGVAPTGHLTYRNNIAVTEQVDYGDFRGAYKTTTDVSNCIASDASLTGAFGVGAVDCQENVLAADIFTDPATFDLTIPWGSVAINTGVAIAEVTDDILGTARPQGALYDVGAYEYVSPMVPDPDPVPGLNTPPRYTRVISVIGANTDE